MKIIINFNQETQDCDIQVTNCAEDNMPIWDVVPFINDALYELVKKEAKKQNLR